MKLLLMMVFISQMVGPVMASDYLSSTQSLSENIQVGAQPSASDIEALAANGIKHVVNVRTHEEMNDLPFDEVNALNEAKIRYHHIPVGKALGYTPKQLEQFSQAMSTVGEDATVLHCKSGFRANLLYAAWLIQTQNKTPKEAKAQVHAWSDHAIGQLLNKNIETE